LSGHDAHIVGLLRTLAPGVEVLPEVPPQRLTQDYLRAQDIAFAQPIQGGLIVVRQFAAQAYTDLLVSLNRRSPAMERGIVAADIRRELSIFLAGHVPREAASLGSIDVAHLHRHFDEWFGRLAVPCRVFVTCVISRWKAPRFSIGPAEFVFIDDIERTEFYPSPDDPFGRSELDDLVELMRQGGANWLARISIEGCERQRAKQLADIATDLAIVAVQLTVPYTAGIGRLYAHRGTPMKLTLCEAEGRFYKDHSWDAPGQLIGTGALNYFLTMNEAIVSSVGDRVRSFSTGRFRLHRLELAWCDAAYWFHEALSEINEAIAVTKLETALEVLMCAGSSKGSQARIEAILEAFYDLGRDDPVHDATTTTAKRFAKEFVEGRSRVLHGTESTLLSRRSHDWEGAVEFVRSVLARAAVEIGTYSDIPNVADDRESFLEWVKIRGESKG
jgi:hypothetical protein